MRSTSRPTWKIWIWAIAPGSADGPASTWPARWSSTGIAPPPRATTPKTSYDILEINYLRFVARAVSDPAVFRRLWRQALRRLFLHKGPLDLAARIALARTRAPVVYAEELSSRSPTAASASSPAGCRRRQAARSGRQSLRALPALPRRRGSHVQPDAPRRRRVRSGAGRLHRNPAPPPAEVLDICAEIVLVRRAGSHSLPFTGRPETVEEFASPAFRAALQQTVRKWSPAIAQLEFTQMAQYAPDCAPARTILVEHDVTFDLYAADCSRSR